METILKRVNQLDFFKALDLETRHALIDKGRWFTLAGGSVLYDQGAPSENVYFVLSGRLVVARDDGDGEEKSIVGYIGSGEPVGEMSLLLDEKHTASVYALRDTELLAISHQEFDALHETHADLAASLSRFILRRSKQTQVSYSKSSPKVFALIGSSPSIDIDHKVKQLAAAVEAFGLDVECMFEREDVPDTLAFDEDELRHDIVILSARVNDSSWYRFVLRHADRFFVFARRDAHPPKPFPLAADRVSPARQFRLVDLVMLEEGAKSCPVIDWRDAVDAQRVFYWHGQDSVNRLARVIAGRSVGVILSGGGARAYAHVGVVRALRERGVPIDFAGGASMGGIIAACVALGWDDAEVDYRVKKAFVDSNGRWRADKQFSN